MIVKPNSTLLRIVATWAMFAETALLPFSALASELRCASIGGGAGEAAASGNLAEASQFSVGHSLVGSISNGTDWLHAGVMHCYVRPLYSLGFSWDFRLDYSDTDNPVSDLSAVVSLRNTGFSNGVVTEAAWFYQYNSDRVRDGNYDLGQRGMFMGWPSWVSNDTVGPAIIDQLTPPPPFPDRGLHPEVDPGVGQAIVGWRSPLDGIIRIRGRWVERSDVTSADGMDWFLDLNDAGSNLDRGTLAPGPPRNNNLGPIVTGVSVGDRVYFVLDKIGNSINDGAVLRAQIRFIGLQAAVLPSGDTNDNAVLPLGDANADFVVDLRDYHALASGKIGPNQLPELKPGAEAGWAELDFDLDADLDNLDFGGFQVAFTGPDLERGDSTE